MKVATKSDKEFMAKIASLPCIACGDYPVQVHHICEGGRRLGHKYTLPLCENCHEGSFSIGNAKKSFTAKYGTELEMLQEVYQILGMEYVPKVSKVYGRTNTK